MNRRLLPAKEIVKAWCEGHRSPSQVSRLLELVTLDRLILLLWMYPRNKTSHYRFELLERAYLEAGEQPSPLLRDLFLGSLRDDSLALAKLASRPHDLPFQLVCDRGAELAQRQSDEELRLRFETELEASCDEETKSFFQVRTLLRNFRHELRQENLEAARSCIEKLNASILDTVGYDMLECQELIAKLQLESAERNPQSLSGYLALQNDTRLFSHDRALITMEAANLLSSRHQLASSLALWLRLIHDEDSSMPPRMRKEAVLLLARDLIAGGEFAAALQELDQPEFGQGNDPTRGSTLRLRAYAHIRQGDILQAEALIAQFDAFPFAINDKYKSLGVLTQVCCLRAKGEIEEALELAANHLKKAWEAESKNSWLPLLARERVRMLRETRPGDDAIVLAAQFAIHASAVVQDPLSMRDVYFTLAVHFADKPESSHNAIDACRDAERCARTIMETLAADRDLLFRIMPRDARNKTVVSALLGRLSENTKQGLKDLFELIRSLVRQAQNATDLLETLREGQRRVARIMETLPIVFWTCFGAAKNFQLCRADGAVTDLLGAEFRGHGGESSAWLETVHTEDREHVVKTLQEVESTLGGRTIRYRRQSTRGHQQSIELQIRPVIGESHEEGVLYGIMSDITEREQLQAALIRNQKTELLGHVVSNITHEFNNVVGGILGAATLLGQSFDQKDSNNYELIQAIERSALRGRDLTAKLSALTAKKSEKQGFIDFSQAVEDAVELARSMHSPEFTIDVILPDESLTTAISRESLTRCLIDLIRNSEESAPVENRILVRVAQDNGFALVSVEDKGAGMADDVLRRAIDPFFSTKDKNQHHGLGLTMVDKICREAKAELTLTSQVGLGTTATLSLPIHQGHSKDHELSRSIDLLMARGGRLLVIDDDPQILKVSRAILQSAGFEVETAFDGQDGLEKFDQEPKTWSLVISDVRMPRLDGLTLITHLRERSKTLPILLMTGYSETSPAAMTRNDDRIEIIHKPFTAGSFLERASSLLISSKEPLA